MKTPTTNQKKPVLSMRTLQSWMTIKKRQHEETHANISDVRLDTWVLYLYTRIDILA